MSSMLECYLRGGERNGELYSIPMLSPDVFVPFSMAHYGRYIRTSEIVRVKGEDEFIGTYRVYVFDNGEGELG